MKVLLVNPDNADQAGFSFPPLNLIYLAGSILNEHEVQLVDGYLLGREGIKKAVTEFRPEIVGITNYTLGHHAVLEIADWIKKFSPQIKIVLGGAHPTIMWKQILENYPQIDVCVIGEGEYTFREFCNGTPVEKLAGIAWRKDNTVVRNPARTYQHHLDHIPFPAWHLLNLKNYPAKGEGVFNGIDLSKEPRVSVVFSRGCTASCDFCSTWWIWKGHRARSAINMANELELLNTKYAAKHFWMADDDFSGDIQAAKELCREIIRRNIKIAWYATTRVDHVDLELLELMKKAGCYEISFGVESGSQKILDLIGKNTTVEQAKLSILNAKKIGLRITALLIVGARGETKDTVNETIDFLNTIRPDGVGAVGGLWILPGTSLYQRAKRERIIDDTYWLRDRPVPIYYGEHTKERIEQFLYAVHSRRKLGTVNFFIGFYVLNRLKNLVKKSTFMSELYRKRLRPLLTA
ncbi:MAG: hypothetical protein A2X86_12275 [Bdellovibrionales bacterium GWA2_49_15]|nr:MAG: hypothetical protein A2X86_12275 [Bdellovibrionales bacterium GWA2_49_15]